MKNIRRETKMDRLLFTAEQIQDKENVDVKKLILQMREARKDMVQNVDQYIFVHKLLIENHILPDTEHTVEELFSRQDWSDLITEELNLLTDRVITAPPYNPDIDEEENVYLNEIHVSPHIIKMHRAAKHEFVYMDAHFIQSEYYTGKFIASTVPQKGRENEFWEMILSKKSKIVVSMENLENDLVIRMQCAQDQVIIYDNIALSVAHIDNSKELFIFDLVVYKLADSKEFLDVQFVIFKNFFKTEHRILTRTLINVVKMIDESLSEDSTAVVCCRNGMNASGVLLVAAMIVKQLEQFEKVDVFRTVKDMRDYRKGMLSDALEYEKCYQFAHEYAVFKHQVNSS